MLHRPGGIPRARNSSASQAGVPGARSSSSFSSDGALPIRQRILAPLRFALPPSRTSQQGVPLRSDATASRRVAVKSSARGSPHNSPITAERHEHLTPSSIAHSASRASRASTWMRFWLGSPGRWIRPLSRIAMQSCTQSSGLSVPTCASRNPAQPPSRGCIANSSDRVGLDGAGSRQRSPNPLGKRSFSSARLPPPRTKVRPAATRLTTFLFYFCSLSGDSEPRVNGATRHAFCGSAACLPPRREKLRFHARSA